MQTHEIKAIAEKIWYILSYKEHMIIGEVIESINSKDFLVFLALGWLAKENKISFSFEYEKLKISIVQDIPEIYY